MRLGAGRVGYADMPPEKNDATRSRRTDGPFLD